MEKQKLSIKNWATEDRPREKLMAHGIRSLSNAELIAILIGSGNREESAVELSRRILNGVNNNLNELSKLTVQDLMENKGIGEAKAIAIVSALELGRRRKSAEVLKRKTIRGSYDVFECMQPVVGHIAHEEFWVLFLNVANKIIDRQKISQGGVARAAVDIRIIMKTALQKLASGIILCHNHLSGNTQPSHQDELLTGKIKEAAGFFDISVLDHVIISENQYYSFADNEKMG